MKNGSRLKFAENLLILERGSDELLLFNVLEQRPLYIKQGGQYIKTFLKAAGRLSTRKKIIQSYPREKRLLDVMLEYGILETDGAGHRSERLEASPGLATSGGKKHMSLYLLLSQSCNMRCVYCLDRQRTYQTAKNLRMSKEVACVLNLKQSRAYRQSGRRKRCGRKNRNGRPNRSVSMKLSRNRSQ